MENTTEADYLVQSQEPVLFREDLGVGGNHCRTGVSSTRVCSFSRGNTHWYRLHLSSSLECLRGLLRIKSEHRDQVL